MDRFVIGTSSIEPLSSPIRYNKSADQLSPTEKLFRRRSRYENPFGCRKYQPMISPVQWTSSHGRVLRSEVTPRLVHAEIFHGAAGIDDHDLLFRLDHADPHWYSFDATLGSGDRIQDLQGPPTLSRNWMIVPTHDARFLDDDLSEDDARCMYESRLAFALDIDLACRVLDVSPPAQRHQRGLGQNSPYDELSLPVTWQDNAWNLSGCIKGRPLFPYYSY
jgi:hypothetical protein